jgi:hypothetical protein
MSAGHFKKARDLVRVVRSDSSVLCNSLLSMIEADRERKPVPDF